LAPERALECLARPLPTGSGTWKQPRPRGSMRHDPSASVLLADLHHSEHAEERGEVDVQARAGVRARLESPGAAEISRREKSRQWPRLACSCREWLGLSLMALGRSARRRPRGRVAARRVASGRHRRDELNVGVNRPIVKASAYVSSGSVQGHHLPQPSIGVRWRRSTSAAEHRENAGRVVGSDRPDRKCQRPTSRPHGIARGREVPQ